METQVGIIIVLSKSKNEKRDIVVEFMLSSQNAFPFLFPFPMCIYYDGLSARKKESFIV